MLPILPEQPTQIMLLLPLSVRLVEVEVEDEEDEEAAVAEAEVCHHLLSKKSQLQNSHNNI